MTLFHRFQPGEMGVYDASGAEPVLLTTFDSPVSGAGRFTVTFDDNTGNLLLCEGFGRGWEITPGG